MMDGNRSCIPLIGYTYMWIDMLCFASDFDLWILTISKFLLLLLSYCCYITHAYMEIVRYWNRLFFKKNYYYYNPYYEEKSFNKHVLALYYHIVEMNGWLIFGVCLLFPIQLVPLRCPLQLAKVCTGVLIFTGQSIAFSRLLRYILSVLCISQTKNRCSRQGSYCGVYILLWGRTGAQTLGVAIWLKSCFREVLKFWFCKVVLLLSSPVLSPWHKLLLN